MRSKQVVGLVVAILIAGCRRGGLGEPGDPGALDGFYRATAINGLPLPQRVLDAAIVGGQYRITRDLVCATLRVGQNSAIAAAIRDSSGGAIAHLEVATDRTDPARGPIGVSTTTYDAPLIVVGASYRLFSFDALVDTSAFPTIDVDISGYETDYPTVLRMTKATSDQASCGSAYPHASSFRPW